MKQILSDAEEYIRRVDFGKRSNEFVFDWLRSKNSHSTIMNCLKAMRSYVFWSKRTPEQSLKDADQEQKLERTDINRKRT